MTADVARVIVLAGWAYIGVGLLFAIAFVTVGVRVIEPRARGGSVLFHVLIVPGCTALWPLLCSKWLRARRGSRSLEEHPDRRSDEAGA